MHIMRKGMNAALTGLAVTAIFATSAAANGVDYGQGSKEYRGPVSVPVPVPAPIPVPEYSPAFYFRIDAAYSFSDSDRFRTDYDAYARGLREDDGLGQFGRYGLGFGYYFTHWLRGDITIDVRNEVVGEALGMVSYTDPATGLAMQDGIADRIRYRNGTLLFNGYVDIPVGYRFTPYVGAGVGVVLHSQSRSLGQIINCVDTVNDCNPSTPLIIDGPMNHHVLSGSDKDYAFALAAALMAGFTTEIGWSTKLDVGYRFLHLDGETFTMRVTDTGSIGGITHRNLTIPDQNIHELRVGLRWDIN